MTDVDAVCFDLDNTLAVHDADGERLLAAAFDRAGVDPLFDAADLSAVDPATLPNADSDREFYESLFVAGATRAGTDPSPETVAAVADAYLDVYDPAAVSFRAGARDALERARERYDVALVTNGGEATQTAKLETLGIRDAFDAAVFCEPAAGIEPKPDPAPLQRALDALGATAERALMVGDGLRTDVAGARAVGMHSAWVPLDEPDPDPDPAPDYALGSMAAVADLL